MTDRKEYRIGRVTYTQEELTWGQTKRLVALLSRAMGRMVDDEVLSIENLVPLLSRYDLIGEALGIALRPRRNGWYWIDRAGLLLRLITRRRGGSLRQVRLDAAANTLVGQVFEDFFFINAPLLKRLTALDGALTWAVQAMTTRETAPPSSNSTTTPTAESRKTTEATAPATAN